MVLSFVLALVSLVAQTPDPAKVEQGRQLFEKNKCLLCHKLDGKGGALSVPLDGVADRRDAEALGRVLRDPETELKDSTAKVKMPKFPLTDEEIETLVAYLRTLKLNGGFAPDPGSAASGDPFARGRDLALRSWLRASRAKSRDAGRAVRGLARHGVAAADPPIKAHDGQEA